MSIVKLNESKGKYHQKIESNQDGINYDPDSSPEAWEYYKKFYTPEYWEIFGLIDFDKLYPLNPREVNPKNHTTTKIKYIRKISMIKIDSCNVYSEDFEKHFKIGGDTVFNFSKDFRINMSKKILKDDKEQLIALEKCINYHHTILNFCLIPVTGNE